MYNKLNSNKMFFIFILIISTLISISSNSWLGCWIGLEINLLSFIPIIYQYNNLLISETSMKYFLTQSIASINLLFMILMNMIFMKIYSLNNFMTIMMNASLIMKMGAAPFHFWFPNIIEGLSWVNCLILMTWQKISPMILLSYCYNMNFMIFSAITSSIIGAIGGMNQISLRKLLAFSSINHMGWMIMAIMISENLWIFYFMFYSMLMNLLCWMFYLINTYFINQLFFNNMNKMNKLIIMLNLFSLGGLPPFMGFLPKWTLINFMIENKFYLITLIFIMMALISLFYYTRIMYSVMFYNYMKLKWFKLNVNNNLWNMINLISFISLNGLIFSTIMFIA